MRKKVILISVFILFFALLGLGMGLEGISAAPVVPRAPDAATIYVRPGGDDVQCNGTVDVDYGAGVAPDCAVQTIGQGISLVDPGGTVYVAAGTYTEQVTIDKALVVQGAGAGSSIIDGTGLGVSNVLRVVSATDDVTVTGFTIQNAGNYQMILSGGDPGATIHIANNAIICTGDVTAQDYGLYGSGGESTVLFQHNTVTDCMYHGFFLERWMGPSEVSYNDFTVGQDTWYLATATGHMTYRRTGSETDPHHVTTRQWIHHNNIDANGRSGVLFISAYGASYNDSRYADGHFTNIEISDNTIFNIGDYTKGIQLETDDDTGGFYDVLIARNTLTAQNVSDGTNTSRGIRILAGAYDTLITENTFTGFYRGLYQSYSWGEPGAVGPTGTQVLNNNFVSNTFAIDNQYITATNVIDARMNWWGDASGPGGVGPGTGDEITANVAYCPWLDGPYPGGSPTSGGGLVTNLNTGENFCTIQSAIDDPETWNGDTIVASPGVYTETVVIDKEITLRGATYTDNKNGYTVPADYAWDPAVESIISAPSPFQDGVVVDIQSSNVTLEGFVIQSLYSTGSGGSGNDPHLVRVQARYNPIDNVVVQNNVIGPNTHVTLQDGTMGRMGLYLSMPNYGDDSYDITNSTFAGNKIFGCEGDGNNVFIWGGAENYNPATRGDLSGTVIEDNEIYGSHRSGIEIAGSADNLTIRDNEIYGNSGLPSDDPTALKYGNGIVIIRMGSDKTSATAEGPVGLTITGNYIQANEKNGIYMGPFNSGHVIAGNSLVDNHWDGIRIDLGEAYHSGATPVYSATENITLHHNDLAYNLRLAARVVGTPTNGFVLDAEDNWFGCNYGPGASGPLCTGFTEISGIIDADPWLVLDLAANPATIFDNETADLIADLTWNSNGVDTSATGHLPDGMSTGFFASSGIVSPTFDHTVSGMAYSVFTPTIDGTAVITTIVDGQRVTATVTISRSQKPVYLPLVMNAYTPMPDLRVTGLTVDPASGLGTGDPVTITVTVENVGDAAAGPFWVDLYDNPDPVPTEANQPWNMVCSGDLLDCYGIAWYVAGGLNAGESITLSSLSGYEADQTHWPGHFVDGGTHDLYAFADSWNWSVDHGAVEERTEGVDNRFGPVTVDVATTRSFVAPVEDEIIISWRPNTP